jgi:hypothetical protein
MDKDFKLKMTQLKKCIPNTESNHNVAVNFKVITILITFFLFIFIIINIGILIPLNLQCRNTPDVDHNTTQQTTPNNGDSINLGVMKTPDETDFTHTRSRLNNSPPYFLKTDIPDLILNEDFSIYALDLSGYADDNEDEPGKLTWFITGENRSLINITNENSSNQQIIFRSVYNAFGKNTVKLWVTDTTGLMAFQIFNLEILPLNDFPKIFNLPVLQVHRNSKYSINLAPYIVDNDTPVDQILIKVKPEDRDREFASFNKHTLNLDFESKSDFNKNYITLELNDQINSSFVKININLTDNYPPTQLKLIPDIILYQGEPLNKILDLDYYFSDTDHANKDIEFEYFLGDHLEIQINAENSIDIDSKANWIGTDHFIIRAMDPVGAFKEQIVNVTVKSTKPEVIFSALPDIQVHYGLEYQFNLTPYLTLNNIEESLEFEIFEFRKNNWIKNTEMSNIFLESNTHQLLKINYSKNYLNETIPVFISVSDGQDTNFQEFRIKVSDNMPPILKRSFPDHLLDEDLNIASALDLYTYFSDTEDGNLRFSNISENVILEIQGNGLADVAHVKNWFGKELVVIRAHDAEDAIVEDSFYVTVNPINDAPKIEAIPELNSTHGIVTTFEYINYISDVDNDISDLTIDVNSDYVTVAGDFLILDYPSNIKGSTQFILTISDGLLSSSQRINVTVYSQNLKERDEGDRLSPIVFWGTVALLLVMIIALCVISFIYLMRLKSFKFEEVFLIYKDGLLIAHASGGRRSSQDSDIFSSMFTAVQDFIHDSFSDADRPTESWPLKRLDFGDFKIAIDRGEYIYIAAVFSGFPIRKMLVRIENLRKEIEKKYIDILPTWAGDMDSLSGAQKIIEELLVSTGGSTNEQPKGRSNKKSVIKDDTKDKDTPLGSKSKEASLTDHDQKPDQDEEMD